MRGIFRFQPYSVLFLLIFCLFSCQVKRPKAVIMDEEMEKILFDYHIAKVMGEELPYNEGYKRILYVESVFHKHGVTKAQFDSSMVWYTRNPNVLSKIYDKVNARLRTERDAVKHLVAIRDNKPGESLSGDSIDVWAWQRFYQLTGLSLSNKITFTLPADINFEDRDTLRWNVDFRFYKGLPDSIHMPIMAMQMVYKNDSIISDLRKIYNTGKETIMLAADTLGEMKEIRGFIYYPHMNAEQVLVLENISLMRYHATDSLFIAKNDTLQVEEKPLVEKQDSDKIEMKQQDQKAVKRVERKEFRQRPTLNPDQMEPIQIESIKMDSDRKK